MRPFQGRARSGDIPRVRRQKAAKPWALTVKRLRRKGHATTAADGKQPGESPVRKGVFARVARGEPRRTGPSARRNARDVQKNACSAQVVMDRALRHRFFARHCGGERYSARGSRIRPNQVDGAPLGCSVSAFRKSQRTRQKRRIKLTRAGRAIFSPYSLHGIHLSAKYRPGGAVKATTGFGSHAAAS